MSYIPNIREKYKESRAGKEKKALNPYWQGFFNDSDYDAMLTYDFAVSTVEHFFENLDIYQEVFSDIIARYESVTGTRTAAVIHRQTEADVVSIPVFNKPGELTDEDIKSVSLQPLLARATYECLMEWLEMQRDELGVSMIDEMQEEEYEKIKEAVLNGERKTEYTKDRAEETEAKG